MSRGRSRKPDEPRRDGRAGGARAGRIDLARSGRRIDIVVDGIPYSTFHPERPWTGYAWDALAAASAFVRSETPSVLLLGAGAGTVLVVSAGSCDVPVAEEAACVAEVMGNKVERLYERLAYWLAPHEGRQADEAAA